MLSTSPEVVKPANCKVVATGTATSAMLVDNASPLAARPPDNARRWGSKPLL